MKFPRFSLRFCALLFFLFSTDAAATITVEDWRAVDPAELSLKNATVEKDADAEALFWEVKIDDSAKGDLILSHYVPIKVFTDRGRESQSKIDLPFGRLYGSEIRINDTIVFATRHDYSSSKLRVYPQLLRAYARRGAGTSRSSEKITQPMVHVGSQIVKTYDELYTAVWVKERDAGGLSPSREI